MKLGVIAGTTTDTMLGLQYVKSQGIEAISRPCSEDPTEQLDMQLHRQKELADRVVSLARDMVDDGAEAIYIYCNSLSTAVDLDWIRAQLPVPVVTPLDVYEECAEKFEHIFAIAANAQCLAGIERIVKARNPDCLFSGAALQSLVYQIEYLLPPEQIVRDLDMGNFLGTFTRMGADTLILGCTHFPYIYDYVRDDIAVPIIDPAKRMLELLGL